MNKALDAIRNFRETMISETDWNAAMPNQQKEWKIICNAMVAINNRLFFDIIIWGVENIGMETYADFTYGKLLAILNRLEQHLKLQAFL